MNVAFALLVLISFGSSFAACGSYASFGFSPDQSLQVFSCDSKKCMVGIRGVEMFPHDYVCDSEDEFIEDVKKRFGRDVPKGRYNAPFRYGNMARQYEPGLIHSGCDFLKVEPVYGIDSVTVALKPKRTGTCPVSVRKTNSRERMYLAVVNKTMGRWNITLEHNRETDESYESEFTFFELPFPLFVKQCEADRCDFMYAEKLPFPYKGRKAVLLTNEQRFKPKCNFVKVESSDSKNVSGTFVLSGTGRCRIQIEEQNDKRKNKRKEPVYNVLNVKKIDSQYHVVLE